MIVNLKMDIWDSSGAINVQVMSSFVLLIQIVLTVDGHGQ